MSTAIEFNNISKQYRLGFVSSRTLSADLNRWWAMNVRGKEDPYLKIGSVNDRATAADSDFVWALRDIDFKVEQGDVVGIIGKNGAGKSTLLKLLSKVTAPTTGTIRARGRIGALLEVGTGFHPEMTGRENIFMNGAIMGMTKQEISRKLDEIVDFSGCERYIDTPVKRYSSGMTVRLGFAVAAFMEPEILVVDEVLAVGDAEFQKKAIGKMQDVSQGEGRTVLFVSHNMASIRALCHHGVLLENGKVKHIGDIHDTVDLYLRDNEFVAKSLIDCMKIKTSDIRIDSVTINSQTENAISLSSDNNEIRIEIKGSCGTDRIIELEAQLFDEKKTLLGSYLPCHKLSRANKYSKGDFVIEEYFQLPKNLAKGTYLMDMQLSHPNVEYLATLTNPVKINAAGISSIAGDRLNYNNSGMLIL